MNRRHALRTLLGTSVVLPGMLSELLAGPSAPEDPLAPRPPHFAPKAKRVIFLHSSGGVSHVDSFDYKPRLFTDHNEPYTVPKKMLDAFAPNNRSELKYYKR